MLRFFILTLAVLCSLSSLVAHAEQATEISAQRLTNIVKVLASDTFEGRALGTPGEDKTIAYLIEQMQGIGL